MAQQSRPRRRASQPGRKTSYVLEPDVAHMLDLAAAELGTSRVQLIQAALRDYLPRRSPLLRRRQRQRDAVATA